jgi:hypothetical protein
LESNISISAPLSTPMQLMRSLFQVAHCVCRQLLMLSGIGPKAGAEENNVRWSQIGPDSLAMHTARMMLPAVG